MLTYIISGFAVGLLVGLTGVGGGSLMTPLLTLLFGVPSSVAVGTDLAFAAITKSVGALVHRVRNSVRWDIVRLLCTGALPAAVAATLWLDSHGTMSKDITQMIRYSIAVSVLLTVVALLFRGKMQAWIAASPRRQLHGPALALTTILCGALLGTMVTISSIGAGAIGATLLVLKPFENSLRLKSPKAVLRPWFETSWSKAMFRPVEAVWMPSGLLEA